MTDGQCDGWRQVCEVKFKMIETSLVGIQASVDALRTELKNGLTRELAQTRQEAAVMQERITTLRNVIAVVGGVLGTTVAGWLIWLFTEGWQRLER